MIELKGREKFAVVFGGGVVLVVLLVFLVIVPVIESMETMDKVITRKRREYKELFTLSEEYKNLKISQDISRKKMGVEQKEFAIFSFLETLAQNVAIKSTIKSMKPSTTSIDEKYEESSVEMKLRKVPIDQLTKYLYRIENSPHPLHIKRIKIDPLFTNPEYLDVVFKVVTYQLK
ncbi:MAG: hypothetical protein SVW57_06960 [Thermodesulfobacteriota bacterium]|nr:hypothetical protein [Thermodesulfobacteriota bacterium]